MKRSSLLARAGAPAPRDVLRPLERDLLDPLIVAALQGFKGLPVAPQPAGVGGSRDRIAALEDELDRAINGLERRDLDGAAVAHDAWITRTGRDRSDAIQHAGLLR